MTKLQVPDIQLNTPDIQLNVEQQRDEVFGKESGLSVGDRRAYKGEDGTWVNAIGLESTEDHRHVSRIWQDKCIPFRDFVKDQREESNRKMDEVRWIRDLEVRKGDLTTGEGLSDTARAHLCGFLGIPPLYLRRLWTDKSTTEERVKLADHNINTLLQEEGENGNREVYLRMRELGEDEEGEKKKICRAVVSMKYGFLDNVEIAEMLWDALPSGRESALASHLWDSGDKVIGNILLPDRMKSYPDSDYGVGIHFANSEDKSRLFVVRPFLFRAICLNGCIWGKRDMKTQLLSSIHKKHLGEIDTKQLAELIKQVVQVALSEGEQLYRLMDISREIEVQSPQGVIAHVTSSNTNSLTKAEGKAWWEGYQVEPDGNAFGIINGLTRAAQEYTGEKRDEMETLAGSMLSPNLYANKGRVESSWDLWNKNANYMIENDEEKVYQYVGIAA
jgi:hypothetical protein